MFTSNFEVPTIAYDLSETLGKWAEQQREELLGEREGVTKKRVKVTFESLPMETTCKTIQPDGTPQCNCGQWCEWYLCQQGCEAAECATWAWSCFCSKWCA